MVAEKTAQFKSILGEAVSKISNSGVTQSKSSLSKEAAGSRLELLKTSTPKSTPVASAADLSQMAAAASAALAAAAAANVTTAELEPILSLEEANQQAFLEVTNRIRELENKIRVQGVLRESDMRRLNRELQTYNDEADKLKKEILELEQEIDRNEKVAWNAIFRNVPARAINDEQIVRKAATAMVKHDFSDETRANLRLPTFNIWKYDESEMMQLMELIFYELGLVDAFQIPPEKLKGFIATIRNNYRGNPFHNFFHGFCVTQMLYSIISLAELDKKLPKINLLILIISGICHDLDHPGFNNAYQVNAHTELAIRYNDVSPLENHHAAVAFSILSLPDCSILENIPQDVYKAVRQGIITCILATDMGRHGEIMNKFKERVEIFDMNSEDDRTLLMQMLIKMSDVSNEARPMEVSEPWVDCLLDEFFNQSDTEKRLGLPVAPFMDREKVTKSQAQIGFIQFVLLPLFEGVAKLFPVLNEWLVKSVREAHTFYVKLKEREEAQRKEAAAAAAQAAQEAQAEAAAAAAATSTSSSSSSSNSSKNPSSAMRSSEGSNAGAKGAVPAPGASASDADLDGKNASSTSHHGIDESEVEGHVPTPSMLQVGKETEKNSKQNSSHAASLAAPSSSPLANAAHASRNNNNEAADAAGSASKDHGAVNANKKSTACMIM